jgi:hypothetical protein
MGEHHIHGLALAFPGLVKLSIEGIDSGGNFSFEKFQAGATAHTFRTFSAVRIQQSG